MTDVEKRLTVALRGVAEDAPHAAGLAEAARGRATRRRRRTTLAVAAASVAVLGVVAGTAMLGNGGGAPPAADDPTPSVVVDPGPPQRVESWRDLQVTVPADWGYGVLSTWCTNGATSPGTPVVERPEGMRDMILCTEPANGYGVMFMDGALADLAYSAGHIWQYEKGDDFAAYPDGAWLGYQRGGGNGDNIVWVVGPDRATTEQVLGSVQRITGVDATAARRSRPTSRLEPQPRARSGCAATAPMAGWSRARSDRAGRRRGRAALDAAPTGQDRRCTLPTDRTYVTSPPERCKVRSLSTSAGVLLGRSATGTDGRCPVLGALARLERADPRRRKPGQAPPVVSPPAPGPRRPGRARRGPAPRGCRWPGRRGSPAAPTRRAE